MLPGQFNGTIIWFKLPESYPKLFVSEVQGFVILKPILSVQSKVAVHRNESRYIDNSF
jgi:hypothetical protein